MARRTAQGRSATGERVLRLRRPTRDRVTPVPVHLDAVLPEDHLARLLWAAVERLDVTVFTDGLKVVEGGPGRSADDPRLLVALWLSATSQGVSSGRVLDRLCVEHLAYLWLCGGVSMHDHTLNAFRVHHGAALDDLFTQVLGQLQHVGLVDLQHVAQDGIRVRASAEAVQVDVTDTGIGMTPEEVEQLFTKFFRSGHRLVREAGGTGLGLTITRSLVELHGGQILVRSTPGQGSTFSVRLPLARQGAEAAIYPAVPPGVPPVC